MTRAPTHTHTQEWNGQVLIIFASFLLNISYFVLSVLQWKSWRAQKSGEWVNAQNTKCERINAAHKTFNIYFDTLLAKCLTINKMRYIYIRNVVSWRASLAYALYLQRFTIDCEFIRFDIINYAKEFPPVPSDNLTVCVSCLRISTISSMPHQPRRRQSATQQCINCQYNLWTMENA